MCICCAGQNRLVIYLFFLLNITLLHKQPCGFDHCLYHWPGQYCWKDIFTASGCPTFLSSTCCVILEKSPWPVYLPTHVINPHTHTPSSSSLNSCRHVWIWVWASAAHESMSASVTHISLSGLLRSLPLSPAFKPVDTCCIHSFIHSFDNKKPNLILNLHFCSSSMVASWLWFNGRLKVKQEKYWETWENDRVIRHHTVHVQEQAYHPPPYTDPFIAVIYFCLWMHYIKWTCGCELLLGNSYCEWVKWEHRKNALKSFYRGIFVHIIGVVLLKYTSLTTKNSLLGNTSVHGRGPTEDPSASLFSLSLSSTSRHNQTVQPCLMNESKTFRSFQSRDAPTTHLREVLF